MSNRRAREPARSTILSIRSVRQRNPQVWNRENHSFISASSDQSMILDGCTGSAETCFFRSRRASKVNAQFGAPSRSWLKCDCQRKLQSMFCFSSCFPPCSCSQDEVLAFWYHLCTERLPPWKVNSCVELFTVFKKFLGPQAATGCKSQVIKGIGKFSRILI